MFAVVMASFSAMVPMGVPGQNSSYAPVNMTPGPDGVDVVVDCPDVVVVVAPVVVVVSPVVVVVVAPVVVVVGASVVVVAPVVVVVAPVVVVVAPVVVVAAPVVVVVALAGQLVSPVKQMIPIPLAPCSSPIASTQVTPAACCADVGGQGKLAASPAAVPVVVQPVIAEVLGTVWVHVGAPAVTGGPTVPDFTTFAPESVPVPLMLVMAIAEQLTGTSFPRNNITDWLGSALHCSMDARLPLSNPAPLMVTESPPARPVHTGAVGTELLHVTPAAVDEKLSVGVAADALVTLVASRTLPMTMAIRPMVASNLEVRLTRSTSPPKSDRSLGTLSAPPVRSVCLLFVLSLVSLCHPAAHRGGPRSARA